MKLWHTAVLLALLIVSACAAPASTPTTTPTDAPTATPLPTLTPTAKPPTATPTRTPDPRCQFPGLPASRTFLDPRDDTDDWQFSEPEEKGMDADLLAEGLSTLRTHPALYSVLIVRGDHLVVERYFNGQTRGNSHEIASTSKSILSALVGLALDDGTLTGTDQTLGELLPGAFENGVPAERSRLTLSNLMTMQTGFAWEPTILRGQSQKSAVSVDAILQTSASSSAAPGGFLYNTGATHLASAVISEASGMSTCEYAYQRLFDPLDITVEWWNQDADGYYTGGWNMYFTPRELAKFGLLYLHQGEWQGRQVIPAAWVAQSLSYHATAGEGSETYYGYWWWLSSLWNYDVYSARGGGGQMIFLLPELDLVFVTTSDAGYQGRPNQFDALAFLWEYVVPSAAADRFKE